MSKRYPIIHGIANCSYKQILFSDFLSISGVFWKALFKEKISFSWLINTSVILSLEVIELNLLNAQKARKHVKTDQNLICDTLFKNDLCLKLDECGVLFINNMK